MKRCGGWIAVVCHLKKPSAKKSKAVRHRDATATGVEVSIFRSDLANAESRGMNSQPGSGFLAGSHRRSLLICMLPVEQAHQVKIEEDCELLTLRGDALTNKGKSPTTVLTSP